MRFLASIWVLGVLLQLASCRTSSKSVQTLSVEQQLINSNVFIDACKAKITNDYNEALKLFKQCIATDPTNHAAYFQVSELLLGKEPQLALAFARKAASLDPTNNWYQLQVAKSYKQSGQLKEAAQQYNIVIGRAPYQVEYYFEQAQLYLMLNKGMYAIATLDNLEKKIGVTEEISLQKKDLYTAIRKPEKAILEMEKLIKEFPDDVRYYNLLADIYLETKQYDKALPMYEKMRQISPNDPMLDMSMAQFYRVKGEYEKSFMHLKKAFGNSMVDIDMKIEILYSYYQLLPRYPELQQKADELIEILVKTHPTEAKAHSMQADFFMQAGQFEKARDAFRRVNAINSSKFVVWSQLMQAELFLNDFTGLKQDSKKTVELFPEQPSAYFFLGYSLNHAKQYDSAVTVLTQGISYVIDNTTLKAEMFSELGNAYNELKKFDDSDKAFEKSLELNPNDFNVLNNYSYYLSERGDKLDKARTMSKKANELHPDDPAYLDTYAWVLYKAGEYTEAEVWIQKALKAGGDKEAVIIEHAGDILFKLGKEVDAVFLWQKAVQAGEGSPLLKQKAEHKKLIE